MAPLTSLVAFLKRFGKFSTIIYFQFSSSNYLPVPKKSLCLYGMERKHANLKTCNYVRCYRYGYLSVADVSFSFCDEFSSIVRNFPYFYR